MAGISVDVGVSDDKDENVFLFTVDKEEGRSFSRMIEDAHCLDQDLRLFFLSQVDQAMNKFLLICSFSFEN